MYSLLSINETLATKKKLILEYYVLVIILPSRCRMGFLTHPYRAADLAIVRSNILTH